MKIGKYIKYSGLIIIAVIFYNIDIKQFSDNFKAIPLSFIVFALLLNIPQLFVKALRWRSMLATQGISYSKKESFLAYMGGLFLGIFTPGRLGEFAKAVYLKADRGIPISRGMSSVIFDRIFDLYFLILLGLIGMWKFSLLGEYPVVGLFLIMVGVFSPCLAVYGNMLNSVKGKLMKISFFREFESLLDARKEFFFGINQLMGWKIVNFMFLTTISYSIFFTQCYILVCSLGLNISISTTILFMAIVNIVCLIPVSVGGIGTRDIVLVYLFSLGKIEPELAVSYSCLDFATFYLFGALLGAIAWWIKPLDLKVLYITTY